MERLTRLVGIGLLVGMVVMAVGQFRQTLFGISSEPTERPVPDPDPTDPGAGSADVSADGSADGVDDDRALSFDPDSRPPQYLSFSPGIRSGHYVIADPPGSRDRDVTPEREQAGDYAPETDLDPSHSLADRGSLPPGLYATSFGVRDCSYEIRRVARSKREVVIGEDRLGQGRMLVSINEIEPDVFVSVPQCGDWSRWSPLTEPLTGAGDGDYWIGDLAEGRWSVPAGCIWEKVVGFRGAVLFDVQESAVGPRPLIVDDETLGVRVRGCPAGLTLDRS